MSALPAPFLFEAFAFFRRHIHPSLLHLMAPATTAASAPAAAKTAKKDLRKDQQSDSLPEANHREMKDLRDHRIPKQQHDGAEDSEAGHGQKKEHEEFWAFKTTSHIIIGF